jgi:hypothetical protein
VLLFRDLEKIHLHGVSRGIVFAADKFLLSYSETRGHALHVLLSVHVMEFSES